MGVGFRGRIYLCFSPDPDVRQWVPALTQPEQGCERSHLICAVSTHRELAPTWTAQGDVVSTCLAPAASLATLCSLPNQLLPNGLAK